MKLMPHYVEKPWGRSDLPAMFAAAADIPIGEVWFQTAEGDQDAALPLLVKYIFTSERLSIQVHPNDAQAQRAGLPRGKQECWYILDCDPGARLGIGLIRETTPDAFAAAALDGSIEQLIDWKPVAPGQFYFIPAGTVHAIGAGITLVEVQQNVDITYRLFDYGRPRELHLAEGSAVSRLKPYDRAMIDVPLGANYRLVDAPDAPFRLDLIHAVPGQRLTLPDQAQIWFIPLSGGGRIAGQPWAPGDCWLIDSSVVPTIEAAADILIAWPT